MQTVLQGSVRFLSFAALCLTLSGCLGNGGIEQLDSPPQIELSISKPRGLERIPFTVIFSETDADREGFPTEVAFEQDSGGTDRATFSLENRLVRTSETTLDLPCFEEPFQIRNDVTGEIVHTQEEFCPRGAWIDHRRLAGLYDDSEQVILVDR